MSKEGSRGGRDLFKVNRVTAGCLVVMMIGAAQAQQPQQLDTVVVTGIRKGIEDAIAVKKNKDNIVESISAEDIGKLPDASVAESIARLPGVTAQRTAGRAQQISIRGMAPDFSTALLNGREQVTTGDSRGVEFDQYPSELLAGVDIYKTPDAALIGQGLSGTVDLKTVRPLSFGKRVLAVNYREQKTGVGLPGNSEGTGERMTASYIDQYFNRKLGVALGWARFSEDAANSRRFEGWGVADSNFGTGTVKTPGGFNSWLDARNQTRTGTMAVIQFRPVKSFESTFDAFFSKFETNKETKGFQAPVGFSSAGGYDPDGVLTSATVANGVATSGTFSNFKGVVRNDSEFFNDRLRSVGWNNKWTGDVWTVAADISRGNAKKTGGILETTAGLPGNFNTNGQNPGTISWTGFDGSNPSSARFTTSANYGDGSVARLTDVMGWGGGTSLPQAGYSKLPFVEDDLDAYRATLSRDLPEGLFFSSVELGFNQTDRSKTRAYVEGRLVIAGTSDPFGSVATPGTAGSIDGIPAVFWDPRGSVGSIYNVAAKRVRDIANKDWNVKERVETSYVKGQIDSEIFGIPVRGNAGLQFVKTHQESTAFNADSSQCPGDVCTTTRSFGSTSYTDVLPSANVVFDLGRDQVLRFGAAKIMARPTLNDMRASLGFGLDAQFRPVANGPIVETLTGGAGTPELEPFRANGLDVSYEKYFGGNKGYVSVAAFHKDIDTYIVTRQLPYNFRSLSTRNSTALPNRPECVVVGTGAWVANPADSCFQGFLTRPVNGSGGSIKGFELAVSVPLNMLWKPLEGFGISANYSDTKSAINLAPAGLSGGQEEVGSATIPLPGLSRKVAGVQLYFERWGFQARVGQRYRSDFVGEITDFTGDRRLTYVKAETVTDAQIGYEFQSGWFKGLSVLLQGYNLNNTPFVRYRLNPQYEERENTKYGKTYLLGVSYKL